MQTVGIRKTQLMKLGEAYGDSGLMNPRSIHPLVYLLADLGEHTFGAAVIDSCRDFIALSNSGFSKQKALTFLTDQMIRTYLSEAFKTEGKADVGSKLKHLPPLSANSYIDYFMTVSLLDRDAFRTPLHPVMGDLTRMVTSYQAEQAGPICDAIVAFFKVTKNQAGFETLLKDLCSLVKGKATQGK